MKQKKDSATAQKHTDIYEPEDVRTRPQVPHVGARSNMDELRTFPAT